MNHCYATSEDAYADEDRDEMMACTVTGGAWDYNKKSCACPAESIGYDKNNGCKMPQPDPYLPPDDGGSTDSGSGTDPGGEVSDPANGGETQPSE